MKRLSILCFMIFAFLISQISVSLAEDSINVSGRIIGADGQAPAMAQVHLAPFAGSYRKAIQMQQADHTGKFSLKIDESGPYTLWVTAANHKVVGIPLILENDNDQVQLDIRLDSYDYRKSFADVKLLGSWNGFKRGAAATMQKQADGTFVFEMDTDSDSVGYQLLDVETSGRSINGTMSDYLEYDGGGDYISGLLVKDNKVKIVFDPSKITRATDPNLPKVSFDAKHENLSELFRIAKQYESTHSDFTKQRAAYEKQHGSAKDFSYDFVPLKTFLSEKMQQRENSLVAEFAAAHLAQLHYLPAQIEDETFSQIIKTIPSNSWLWDETLMPVAEAMGLKHPQDTWQFLQGVYKNNPNHAVQAQALVEMVFLASVRGDSATYQSLYSELASKFADVSDVDYYRMILDPNSTVAAGQSVPEFELKQIGSQETVSNQSMLGKFYLIDFWATWCGPCKEEMGHLHDAYEKYKDSNFTILSISLDKSPEEIRKFRNGWKMPWLHACVNADWQNETVKAFGVTGIPSPFLVSPDGKILASHLALRGEYLDRTLAKYLGSN